MGHCLVSDIGRATLVGRFLGMKVTIIRRVKRVGHKWKLVSAKKYIVWRPEEMLLSRSVWRRMETQLGLTKE